MFAGVEICPINIVHAPVKPLSKLCGAGSHVLPQDMEAEGRPVWMGK